MSAGARRVVLGHVRRPHGLNGEVVVAGVRISLEELRGVGPLSGRDAAGGLRTLTIATARPFVSNLLVRFEGVTDRDAAQELAGLDLEIDPARLPRLAPGELYVFELLGLTVATEAGESLGRVHDVMQTGAAPILVVRADAVGGGKARERLVPMSPDMLMGVDVAAGRITVRLLPGMEDL